MLEQQPFQASIQWIVTDSDAAELRALLEAEFGTDWADENATAFHAAYTAMPSELQQTVEPALAGDNPREQAQILYDAIVRTRPATASQAAPAAATVDGEYDDAVPLSQQPGWEAFTGWWTRVDNGQWRYATSKNVNANWSSQPPDRPADEIEYDDAVPLSQQPGWEAFTGWWMRVDNGQWRYAASKKVSAEWSDQPPTAPPTADVAETTLTDEQAAASRILQESLIRLREEMPEAAELSTEELTALLHEVIEELAPAPAGN